MTLFFSLILGFAFIFCAKSVIKTHSGVFYACSALVAVLVVVISIFGLESSVPNFVATKILPVFSNSGLSTALYIYIMYANAVPKGHFIMKTVMPIRAELSIIATILTLGHNIYYGITYFPTVFTAPSELETRFLLAAICSLVMMAIMLPLFLTSFKSVRNKMNAKTWKNLQKSAYIFYALIYIHVLILTIPMAVLGDVKSQIMIFVYSVVFIGYAVLRLGKAFGENDAVYRKFISGLGLAVFLIINAVSLSSAIFGIPENEITSEEVQAVPVAYSDGIFSGKGMGYNDYIYVDVTVVDGKISAVEVTKHREETPYLRRAQALIDVIIQTQNTKVDTITGATMSSLGLIEGIEEALSKSATTE